MIKLFVSDLDGTLLNEDHTLSAENKAAISALRKSGVSFMPASGRDYLGVQEVIQGLNITPKCICLNGAEFYDNDGKLLVSNPILESKAREIQKLIEVLACDVNYFCEDGCYLCFDGSEDAVKALLYKRYQLIFGVEDVDTFLKEHTFIKTYVEPDIEKILKRKLLKIELIFDNQEKKAIALQQLSKIKDISITSSQASNVEINDALANKGHMVEQVCKFYGYRKEEVLVVGDGSNDITMLERFENSYAMGQASDEIKKVAKHVAKSNKEHGVAQLIYEVMKQNEKGVD